MALELNLIYNMDCREGLKLLEDNSIDSIVTDPPYELGFMGKSWDKTGIAYNVELWHECLRVLKPGGHLLAFGGTRTYHRMTCAIEDAGFEIRDCIQWLYGTGFPKSHNISKAIDKKLGAEREVVGYTKGRSSPIHGGGQSVGKDDPVTVSATPESQEWDGWGTALKPANEPIVLARKPLSEKTIVDNVLKWGTGGINIDDCRIPTNDKLGGGALTGSFSASEGWDRPWRHDEDVIKEKVQETKLKVAKAESSGRFPANVILDEEAGKLLDEQSGISKSTGGSGEKSRGALGKNVYGKYSLNIKASNAGGLGDSGGASRFFYCAKASKSERNIGLEDMPLRNNMRVNAPRRSEEEKISTMHKNFHPTVKPIKLIEYLIKLVTPPNGVCLDPFEGSGTHALACINLGFNFIGFELNKDYYNIAIARINHAKQHTRQISLIE